MKSRRFGKFNISLDMIERSPELVKKALADILIVRAEVMLCEGVISYTGICDRFEPILEGNLAPVYHLGAGPNGLSLE